MVSCVDVCVGERCKPFRQLSDMTLGIVGVGLVVGGHDLVADRVCALVIHIVREIVEMEEPVHEIAAHPQLTERRRWVACTS